MDYKYFYDRRYKGALCKNNDGIFFENENGIVLRRRGEENCEYIFKNSTYSTAERYNDPFGSQDPECAVWNVADGWLYYSDWEESSFDHEDKSSYHPEDYIINRVNYNTGEEQSFSIFPLLIYGEWAETTSDPHETKADVSHDVLEYRFVSSIGGNSSVIITDGGYMEYVEINDDGSWVLYYYDVTVHEVKTFEFDKTKQYEIP